MVNGISTEDLSRFLVFAKCIIIEAAKNRNLSVSIYFNPETGVSLMTSPWPGVDDLEEMFSQGLISRNELLEKMSIKNLDD